MQWKSVCSIIWLFLFAVLASSAHAQRIILPPPPQNTQTTAPVEPSPEASASRLAKQSSGATQQTPPAKSPAIQHEGNLFQEIWKDQKSIVTGHLELKKKDLYWLLPVAATTVAMIANDRSLNRKFLGGEETLEVSSKISQLGANYTVFTLTGLAYAIGKISHDDRMKDTGRLGLEALINTEIVVGGLKLATGRRRPTSNFNRSNFFKAGRSFPSGHTAASWALATVVASEYHDNPYMRFGAYTVATAVSIARLTGQKHFMSDILVGGSIGYLIGRFTLRRHGITGKSSMITPSLDPATRSYGATASFSF